MGNLRRSRRGFDATCKHRLASITFESGTTAFQAFRKTSLAADQDKRSKLAAQQAHAAVFDVAAVLENPARQLFNNPRPVGSQAGDNQVLFTVHGTLSGNSMWAAQHPTTLPYSVKLRNPHSEIRI